MCCLFVEQELQQSSIYLHYIDALVPCAWAKLEIGKVLWRRSILPFVKLPIPLMNDTCHGIF